ncbi:hypothetical protein COB72_08615 [bacterium]|nr:MAG: hypothetical protein COB72_08615 [bacterium]
MLPVVENESQLQNTKAIDARSVKLDVHPSAAQLSQTCSSADSGCCCDQCVAPASLLGQATCIMVGASTHARDKSKHSRFGAQALHWGVVFVAILVSLPMVLPTLSPATREWLNVNLLNSPGSWKVWVLSLVAAGLFSFGFVNRLGTERIHGGCAMLRRLGPAALLGIAWSIIPSFAGVMLVLNMEPIRLALIGDGLSMSHLIVGMSIYLVAFVLLAGFGFLPTVSQAILAGYAFGVPMGLGLALLGFGGASLVGYELVGRIARSRVEQELQRKPKAVMLRDALVHASTGRALLLVTLLRASPSAPFALTNLLLGSLGVSRGVFVLGTIMGMFPRTLAAVLIGQQFTTFGEIDKPRWMIVAGIVAVVLLLIVVSKVAASVLRRVATNTTLEQVA